MSDTFDKALPIYQDANGEYRFRVVAGNGEIVASGESYKTRADAKRGRDALIRIILKARTDGTTTPDSNE